MKTMPVVQATRPPNFDDLQRHGQPLDLDWFGAKIPAPVRSLFWMTGEHFHFLAGSDLDAGTSAPGSKLSQYQAELWKYDVAEFFLCDPATGHYLEFNLAPNGAWWSCQFTGIRTPARHEPKAIEGVEIEVAGDEHSWQGHARLPLSWLQDHCRLGPESTLNATFILKSPARIFLTAGPAAPGPPDFHRPDEFPPIEFTALA